MGFLIGIEAAGEALNQATRAAFADANLEPVPPRAICLGLSGVDRAADFDVIRAWLTEQMPGTPFAEEYSMNIRPMLESDVMPLARLMALTPLWQHYNVTEATAAMRLSEGLACGATIAVAELNGEPVGFVWYVKCGAFDRSGYIKLIGVKPERRGNSIGRGLMQHAEAILFASSPDIFLLVSDFNHDARKFYARLGYNQVGAIPDYVMPGITELILHKRLT